LGLQKAATDKKFTTARTGAAATLLSMAKTSKSAVEPYLIPALAWCLDLAGDKETATRDNSAEAAKYIVSEVVSPTSITAVIPQLLDALAFAKKWQTKVLALELISSLSKSAPEKVQKEMPKVIPAVTPCMNDSKAQVAAQAYTTMSDVCKVCGGFRSRYA
jgi:elongation factor 3